MKTQLQAENSSVALKSPDLFTFLIVLDIMFNVSSFTTYDGVEGNIFGFIQGRNWEWRKWVENEEIAAQGE